jgi:hypothetical protein
MTDVPVNRDALGVKALAITRSVGVVPGGGK